MSATRLTSLALTSILLIACSPSTDTETTPPSDADGGAASVDDVHSSEFYDGKLTGTIVLSTGVNPPTGSTLAVELDQGKMSAETSDITHARVDLQETAISGPPPWSFELTADEASFDQDATYTVKVTVTSPDGVIWFANMPSAVFRQTEEHVPLEISLTPMDAAAAGE